MPWDLSRIEPPWDRSRPSIYGFIADHVDAGGILEQEAPDLPDEVHEPNSVTFAAGALDGVSRHFGVAYAEDDVVTAVVGAVAKLARRSTARSAERLYTLVTETPTLEFIDKALPFIMSTGADPDRIKAIGHWLATEAPDRSAVKFGIALLGMIEPVDVATLQLLGAHDEFTLYAAVALKNSAAGDQALFELAKRVDGWGRIHCVERLEDTTDPEIQEWMLRDGFKNSIMYEYLALTCAQTGGLAEALAAPDVDDELVSSAGEMLATLLAGQPGPPPSEYSELVPALAGYLDHISRRAGSLHDRICVSAIRDFLDDPDDVAIPEVEHRSMNATADEFLGRPHFAEQAMVGLLDPDRVVHAQASDTARDLGIDIYEAVYRRIEEEFDEYPLWFDLLKATDKDRISRSLALGREKIDLTTLGSGPSEAMGLGPDFQADGDLGLFLQELRRFPGEGLDMIEVGLRNPVVRNRNLSIRALQELPRNEWPRGAEAALQTAIDNEVKDDVRTFAMDVMRGDVPLPEAWRRAIEELQERDQELADLATALAATPQGMQLRVKAGFTQFAMWDGPYDTTPWEQLHVSVSRDTNGFAAELREGMSDRADERVYLTPPEAKKRAVALMNRLLVE